MNYGLLTDGLEYSWQEGYDVWCFEVSIASCSLPYRGLFGWVGTCPKSHRAWRPGQFGNWSATIKSPKKCVDLDWTMVAWFRCLRLRESSGCTRSVWSRDVFRGEDVENPPKYPSFPNMVPGTCLYDIDMGVMESSVFPSMILGRDTCDY